MEFRLLVFLIVSLGVPLTGVHVMMLLVLSFFAEENDVSGVIREWETSGKSPEEKEVVSIGGDDVVSVIVVTTAVVSSLSDLDIEDTNEVRL